MSETSETSETKQTTKVDGTVTLSQTVASVVAGHTECAEVFMRHRIDFCCRGDQSIQQAATERGVDTQTLLRELENAILARNPTAEPTVTELSTAALLAHIVQQHHAYLRQALPFLVPLGAKVARVHGDHNPKLKKLAEAVQKLSDTLLAHLDDEEQVLFPALLSADTPADEKTQKLLAMKQEHLLVAEQLRQIRESSDDFSLPDWACRSYQALFGELLALEKDVFTHVHLENHVVLPRFVGV